jgi:hypothetical protein
MAPIRPSTCPYPRRDCFLGTTELGSYYHKCMRGKYAWAHKEMGVCPIYNHPFRNLNYRNPQDTYGLNLETINYCGTGQFLRYDK